jgi:hypothetical protein
MARDAKLSQLLIEYIGYGRYAVPRCTWDRVDLSAQDASIKSQVVSLVSELSSYEIDWAGKSLVDGSLQLRDVMASRHPELSEPALDALAWLFSYGWK